MPIIIISSEAPAVEEQIAARAANALGYKTLGPDVLPAIAAKHAIPEARLAESLGRTPTPWWRRQAKGRQHQRHGQQRADAAPRHGRGMAFEEAPLGRCSDRRRGRCGSGFAGLRRGSRPGGAGAHGAVRAAARWTVKRRLAYGHAAHRSRTSGIGFHVITLRWRLHPRVRTTGRGRGAWIDPSRGARFGSGWRGQGMIRICRPGPTPTATLMRQSSMLIARPWSNAPAPPVCRGWCCRRWR